MNLERLYPIWFILCASAGAVVGNLTGYGAIHGLTDGMMVAVSPLFLLMMGLLLMSFWRPILPPCRCGHSNHKGYRHVSPADDAKSGIRFECPKCGRAYELSKDRFDEIASDGHTIPYMRHTKWGRWRKAKAEMAA